MVFLRYFFCSFYFVHVERSCRHKIKLVERREQAGWGQGSVMVRIYVEVFAAYGSSAGLARVVDHNLNLVRNAHAGHARGQRKDRHIYF